MFVSEDEDEDVEQQRPLLGTPIGDFRVLAPEGLAVREKPSHRAEHTGEVLAKGAVFTAVECVTPGIEDKPPTRWDHVPVEEACFLKLGGGRGWVEDRHLITEAFLVEPLYPAEKVGCFAAFRNTLRLFFQGKCYEYAIMSIVVLNAIFIGLEIDFHHIMPPWVWFAANGIFTTIYVVELSLKLLAWGVCQYFESRWNQFDCLVTLTTLAGDVLVFWAQTSGQTGKSNLQVITAIAPLLRLLRLLRLAKAFRDLRTLMKAFLSSLGSLVWIGVFTLLWFYISACVTTVFLGSKEWMPDDPKIPGASDTRHMFQNIPRSMFTLFEVMTIEGWGDAVHPILGHRPFLVGFFFVFVFVTAFFLLNLVTAVVVDHTVAAQAKDADATKTASADSQELTVKHLQEQLTKRNRGKDDCADSDVLEMCKAPGIEATLDSVNWTMDDMRAAIRSVDIRGDGIISLAALCQVITDCGKDLDTRTILRHNADVTQRLVRQEKILYQLLENAKLSRSS